jgi:hypothetical protein
MQHRCIVEEVSMTQDGEPPQDLLINVLLVHLLGNSVTWRYLDTHQVPCYDGHIPRPGRVALAEHVQKLIEVRNISPLVALLHWRGARVSDSRDREISECHGRALSRPGRAFP